MIVGMHGTQTWHTETERGSDPVDRFIAQHFDRVTVVPHALAGHDVMPEAIWSRHHVMLPTCVLKIDIFNHAGSHADGGY